MSGHKEEPLKRTTMVHLTGRYAFPAAKPPVLGSKTTGVRVEEMRIGAALSTDPDPAKATAEAVEEARSQLGPGVISAPPGSVRWGLCIATGWVDRHSPVSVRGHEGLNQH